MFTSIYRRVFARRCHEFWWGPSDGDRKIQRVLLLSRSIHQPRNARQPVQISGKRQTTNSKV